MTLFPGRRSGLPRPRAAVVVATALLAALAGCSGSGGSTAPYAPDAADTGDAAGAAYRPAVPTSLSALPTLSLGKGLLAFPDAASAWVRANPTDPRAARIARSMAGRPTALWLTGDESFGNLAEAVRTARAADRTMLLTLYNIPLRWDGLSEPSRVSLSTYQRWIDRVAAGIGTTRAIVVLEPDALWFYDRMPTDADRATRIKALRYAVDTLAQRAPRTRVYLEAGTSSGSVTPARMAALLLKAGVRDAAGYAVNVSSYSPTPTIQAYAQQIRAALQARGLADPRYVTDTGRNGASSWDNDWCNPSEQELGRAPRLLRSTDGRDLDLWIKAPGTSDGDCGPAGGGAGTYGGEFLPQVAYDMIGG